MSLDRRVALLGWLVAAAVIGITASVSEAPGIPVEHDEEAFAELIANLDAGGRGDWLIDYDVNEQNRSGQTITGLVSEARRGDVHVRAGKYSATVERDGTAFECLVLEKGLSCLPRVEVPTLPPAAVVRNIVDVGAYVVTRLRGEQIAGESGDCFRVFAARGLVEQVGAEIRYCFADDGLVLWTRAVRRDGIDERRARLVVRDPSMARVQGLLSRLEAIDAEADG